VTTGPLTEPTTEPVTAISTATSTAPEPTSMTEVVGDVGLLQRGVDRRVLLAGTGVGCALLLAACGGGSGSNDSSDSASDSSTLGGSSTESGGSAKALATLASIKVGSAVSAQDGDGNPIIVARPTADTAVAFSAICTHQGCTVAPAGSELDCPCHGSRYNATTGKVLGGPAPKPLPAIAVSVRNGQVFQS
jgi:cytochrome b6-f complex iron-sulfur subunit